MKRLLFYGLPALFMLVTSCADKTAETTTTASGSDTQKEMLENNAKVMKAIETGDTAVLAKYISDDAVDHGGGPNGTDIKGPEIRRMLADVHNHIENFKMEIVEQAASDDHIFSLTRITGDVKSEVWGMHAGMKADMTSVDVLKVRDGKLVDHWSYMNPADMMKMMPPAGDKPMKMGADSMKH